MSPMNLSKLEGNYLVNPHCHYARKECQEYFGRIKIRFNETILQMVTWGFPLVPRDDFVLITKILVLQFHVDDILDSEDIPLKERTDYLNDVIEDLVRDRAKLPNSVGAYLLELIDQMHPAVRMSYKREYLLSLRDSLEKTTTPVSSLEEYVKLRKNDIGTNFTFLLLFIDKQDYKLYDDFLESDLGKQIVDLATTNIIFMNDIVSLPKEMYKKELFNSVYILVKMENYKETEALNIVRAKCNESFELLNNIVAEDDVGRDVLLKIKLFCRGVNIWSYITPRYAI